MRYGERGGHGQPVEEQRPLGFPRQIPHQRHQNDEAHFEEDRQPHQKRRNQHGPRRAVLAESQQQPVRQGASAARIFQIAADHGSQPYHHRDETEGFAESGLNGSEDFVGGHPGGEPERHGGKQQREKRIQLHRQDQNQQKCNGCRGE